VASLRTITALCVCTWALTNASAYSREDYFATMDVDGSGKVSLAEFQSWMRYAFDRIDRNGNNVIDQDEAIVPKMRGRTRARHRQLIAAQFAKQDRNNDQHLSITELTAPPQK
jgi:EF hand